MNFSNTPVRLSLDGNICISSVFTKHSTSNAAKLNEIKGAVSQIHLRHKRELTSAKYSTQLHNDKNNESLVGTLWLSDVVGKIISKVSR